MPGQTNGAALNLIESDFIKTSPVLTTSRTRRLKPAGPAPLVERLDCDFPDLSGSDVVSGCKP